MTAARKQKLKVYCTPVGFHDAYVAVPSQKAALEAWGAKTNLFAQGAAHPVTDDRLTKAPLQHPGEVIKVLRGSDAEQLAALEAVSHRKAPSPSQPSAGSLPLPRGERARSRGARVKPRGAKPSRAKLTKAEEALEALEERQSKQLREIEEQQRQLERKRSELKRRHAGELDKAKERVATEKEQYEQAVGSWAGGE